MPIASIAFLILVQSHVRSWCEVRWTTACLLHRLAIERSSRPQVNLSPRSIRSQ